MKACPTPRALVVDDDRQLTELMCSILVCGGYDATGADCLKRAKSYLEKGPFTVTFLDLNLPDSKPSETVDFIPELKRMGGGRVVAITGLPVPARWQATAILAGADGFLSKLEGHFTERLLDEAKAIRENR